MAVYTYGASNISFGTFYIWSNGVASNSNVTIGDALNDAVPAESVPNQASEISNNNWFYGTLQVSTGGYVDISAGGSYSVADSTGATIKNVNLDLNNLVLSADETAAYPRTFVRWRSGGAGGSEIQTGEVLTLKSDNNTGVKGLYEEFT